MKRYIMAMLEPYRQDIDEARSQGWTGEVDSTLLPCTICHASRDGTLQQLVEEVYDKTMMVHPRKDEVRKYILDWLFATGSYFIMEEGAVCSIPAYHEAMDYAHMLGKPLN